MKMEVQAIEYTCDGCAKSTVAKDEDEVLGLSGDVFEVTKYGGNGAEWWACSRKCIAKAIINVLDSLSR